MIFWQKNGARNTYPNFVHKEKEIKREVELSQDPHKEKKNENKEDLVCF